MTTATEPIAGPTAEALEVIRLLASEIGPRRPCSAAERRAGEALAGWLRQRDLEAQLEEHRGYSTFATPYGLLFGAAFVAGLLQPRHPRTGTAIAASAAGLAALEGDLRVTPISDFCPAARGPISSPPSRPPAPHAGGSAWSGTWTPRATA